MPIIVAHFSSRWEQGRLPDLKIGIEWKLRF